MYGAMDLMVTTKDVSLPNRLVEQYMAKLAPEVFSSLKLPDNGKPKNHRNSVHRHDLFIEDENFI